MSRELEIARGQGAVMLAEKPVMPRMAADRIDMRWLLSTIRRRRRFVIGSVLVCLAVALVFTAVRKPLYVATSHVVLNVRSDEIAPSGQTAAPTEFSQEAADTQLEVIKSRDNAERTADALLASDRASADALIDPKPGIIGSVRNALMGAKPVDEAPASRRDRLVESLLANANIQRALNTYAVSIAFYGPSPKVAASAANAIAETYAGSQYVDKRDENKQAIAFLGKRIEELRAQANADTNAVQQYRIAHNLLSTSGASLTEQEISNYDQQVATARTEAAGDAAALATAQAQLRNGSNGGDVGEALGSGVVSSLRAKRAEISAQLANATARHGDSNPDVIQFRNQLADVDQQIADEIKRVISNLQAKARVSAGRLSSIEGSLGSARGALAQNNRADVQLSDLQRKADASQSLYESYLGRYKEVSAREGTEHSDAKVITKATEPNWPASPNMPLNAMLGLLVGLGIGIGGAFAAEIGFSGLTTSEDVERRTGLHYLGGTPLVRSSRIEELIDLPVTNPHDLFSHGIQIVKSSIVQGGTAPDARVIGLTSALPNEGKTTTSIALARCFALGGLETVLVDCDFRRHRMSDMIGGDGAQAGLVEVLSGKATLDQALIHDPTSGAWLLPVIQTPPETARLLTGEAMDRLLEQLRDRFRYVLLDTPPVLAVPETREILAKADTSVMLMRWRRTADHAIQTALRMLPPEYVHISGAILTAINVKGEAGWGKGDATYYHRQYSTYLR